MLNLETRTLSSDAVFFRWYILPEFVKNCLLCGSQENRLFDLREFRGIEVSNRICNHCGLVFQSPRMDSGELSKFYIHQYRQLYQDDEQPAPGDLVSQAGRADELLSFSRSYLQTISNHLDIGCSAGLLLLKFREEYGCSSIGVEPGEAYRRYAQNQGLTVVPSLEEIPDHTVANGNNDSGQDKTRFDLVSMAHVLEHMLDPIEFLQTLKKRFLSNSGYLLIEVPNLYCHDSFEVAHMVSFSSHTLSQTLNKAGYSVIMTRNHGEPRSSLLRLYITILAKPEPQVTDYAVLPERGVQQKRRFGLLRRRILSRIAPKQAWKPLS